jgi:ABC-type anion transport system duplicated permease subunit
MQTQTLAEIVQLAIGAWGLGLTLISILIGVIWKFLRAEQAKTSIELELKASKAALRESEERALAACSALREYFAERLQMQAAEYRERLADQANRQDREISWVKKEVDELKASMGALRKETQEGFNNLRNENRQGIDQVLDRLQELIISVK